MYTGYNKINRYDDIVVLKVKYVLLKTMLPVCMKYATRGES